MAKIAVYLVAAVAVSVIAGLDARLCRGANKVWSKCPSACPLTCENPNPAEVCIDVCKPAGCVCKKGYVLKGDDCVRVEDCKNNEQTCPANQIWSNCPSACPLTCDRQRPIGACIQVCRTPGCICKPGFVANANNECVLPNQCNKPPTCPINEVWSTCPSSCPKTCDNRNSTDACIQLCQPAGCVCKEGLVRFGKECVPVDQCPSQQCPANQIWSTCPSSCPKTCDNRNSTDVCIQLCKPAGCVCKPGFVLKKGECVSESTC